MTTHVLLLLPAAFLVGLALTAVLCRVGRRMETLDTPGGAGTLKELRDVPNIGGIAIAWPLIAALLGTALLVMLLPQMLTSLVPATEPWMSRLQGTAPTAIAFAASLLVLHVAGVFDDRRELGPWTKLGIQVVVTGVLAAVFDIRLLQQLDGVAGIGITFSVIASVIWMVAIINAMNFLDNMDGLTAGVTVVAGGLLLVTAVLSEQWFVAGTLAVLVGSTAGFLVFNLPPAKIFMGDGGSMVIGLALAVLTIRTTYVESTASSGGVIGTAWYGVLMPLAVLAIPLYDLVSVTWIRLRQGRSPFAGDHQHFSHRLVELGLSPRRAVFVIWCLSAVTGIVGMLLPSLVPWQAAMAGSLVVLVMVVLAVLESGVHR
ncbi:MAG: undecaprenyl/decaprenyl-phosphate alpha-N-acetylglucosaminyl 1-phosphate transferase [Planctomycetes bacterium]|nr:undecaprenyl/decaprenyl-phosphate alpha-N-acetylglucosaminyl 1-phosphate transferase [Planctomycetota bacterium]